MTRKNESGWSLKESCPGFSTLCASFPILRCPSLTGSFLFSLDFLKIMTHKTKWHTSFPHSSKISVIRIKWLDNEYRFLAFCVGSGSNKWLTIERGFKALDCWILILTVSKMSDQFALTNLANLSIINCRSELKGPLYISKKKKIKVHKVYNFIPSLANICQHLKRARSKRA